MKTILFQGDSITDAERSRELDYRTGCGYPTLVAGELGFDYPNEYRFYNRGISGNRVVDVYARIKEDIINLRPDIMSILVGVNDVWHEIRYNNGIDAEKYYNIYSVMLEEIRTALPDTKIMILEPFVLKGSATEDEWETFRAEVKKRAEKAKTAAEKYQLPFIPLQGLLDEAVRLAPPDYWLLDGVHPTSAGHELIKREWIKMFKQL